MLYIVATPIGNLSDITYRAVETLNFCDYILCEDTRHSKTLCSHYNIRTPLKSYHKYSELSKADDILKDLQQGKNIALISDAGTPCISDPGTLLVQLCYDNDIEVTTIPGPCAIIQALTLTGLDTTNFQFIGFLTKKKEQLKKQLLLALSYQGITVGYESPIRLCKTLQVINDIEPSAEIIVARELTKKFETIHRNTASELLKYFSEEPPKGEIVLLIPPHKPENWDDLSPQEHVKVIADMYDIPLKEAIKMVAQLRGIHKRELYLKKD